MLIVSDLSRGVDGGGLCRRLVVEDAQRGEVVLDLLEGVEDAFAVISGLGFVGVARLVGHGVAAACVEQRFNGGGAERP